MNNMNNMAHSPVIIIFGALYVLIGSTVYFASTSLLDSIFIPLNDYERSWSVDERLTPVSFLSRSASSFLDPEGSFSMMNTSSTASSWYL